MMSYYFIQEQLFTQAYKNIIYTYSKMWNYAFGFKKPKSMNENGL